MLCLMSVGMLNKPLFFFADAYSERGREGRLIRLVSDTYNTQANGVPFGIGVDEDTALFVTSDLDGSNPIGEVFGRGGVFFVDVREAQVKTKRGYAKQLKHRMKPLKCCGMPYVCSQWSIEGVRTHYLKQGDRINLSTFGDVAFAPYKFDLEGEEAFRRALVSEERIFDGLCGGQCLDRNVPEYVNVAASLLDS